MNKITEHKQFVLAASICFAVIFTFAVLLSPSIFAQTPSSGNSQQKIEENQSTGQSVSDQSQADASDTSQASASITDRSTKARQYMELINSVFNFVMQNYVDEVDPYILYQGAMEGLMNSLNDPYTVYLDVSDMQSLNDTTVGNFGGVGLSITKPSVSTAANPAYVEVASPVEGGPGWKAGIQSGDMIISIDGTDTPGISMEEVLAKLRGEIGTSVSIVIKRGKNMELPFTLVRELIEVPTVKYGMINETGYLRIIEFTPQTPERVQEALDSFANANYKNLIIDLRNNPGGLITSVADVADKFIDSGTIVSTKSRLPYDNSVYTAVSKKTTVPSGLPIVVLINRGSASASEILSGALKDDHLAYLVGENTYGKGSVQQPIPLPYSDGIKLTIARYYTPSDSNIDKIGIPPDLEVLFPDFTDEEEKAYVELMSTDVVAEYVEEHQSMTEADIEKYTEELKNTYNLESRVLRRIIRLEVYRTRNPLLYDLDFDLQLQAALDVLQKGDFQSLLQTTKTLKQLQEEAQAKKIAEESNSTADSVTSDSAGNLVE